MLYLDSSWASPCGSQNEGPLINTVCSSREIPLPERSEDTQVALELPILGTSSSLQGSQSQSSELGCSSVTSLGAVKEDIKKDSQTSHNILEIGTHGFFTKSKKHQFVVAQHQSEDEPHEIELSSVVYHCQTEGEPSANEQTVVTLQPHVDVQPTVGELAQLTSLNKVEACDELQNSLGKDEVGSQPNLIRHRRGRPPKRVRHPQQPMKEMLQSQPSVIPTGTEVLKNPTVREEEFKASPLVDNALIILSKSSQTCPVKSKETSSITTLSSQGKANSASEDVENNQVGSLSLAVPPQQLSMNIKRGAIHPPQAQPGEYGTSVTLLDMKLLDKAMYRSLAENVFSSDQRMTAPIQTQPAPNTGAPQTVETAPAEQQALPHRVKTHVAARTLPTTELHITPQSTAAKLSASCETVDVNTSNEIQAHITAVIPKQHNAIVSSTTTSSMLPSTQTSVQSLHCYRSHPLITSTSPSSRGKSVPQKIIIIPRLVSSLQPSTPIVQSPNKPPTITPNIFAQHNDIVRGSTAVEFPLCTPSSSSLPEKTTVVTSRKLLPVVTRSTTNTKDLQSRTQLHPKITAVVPRQDSQTIVHAADQESSKLEGPAVLSVSEVMSSPQKRSFSVETKTALDEVAITSSQKKDNTSDNLKSPKQAAPVSETANVYVQTHSSFNMSTGLVVPPALKQKLSAVVRLTRLPFPASTKESVKVSRMARSVCCDCQSFLIPGTAQEKTPSLGKSVQPSKTADTYASIKETVVAPPSEQLIDTMASVSSENRTTLDELSNNGYWQPSTSSSVSIPVIQKSTITTNVTEPSEVTCTTDEPSSSFKEEIILNKIQDKTRQDSTLLKDQPKEIQSPLSIHFPSITSKDASDPHLLMSKKQFLAHLAVSPAVKAPEKVMQ